MIVRPTSPRRRPRGWPLFGAIAIVVACLVPMLALAQDAGCRAPAFDLANACLLASGVPVRGLIDQPGGSTAFRFEIGAAGGQASLVLDDLPADYDLYLTDDHGSILGQSVHDGIASEELLIRLPAGTYYALVQSDPGRDVDPYRPFTLRLSLSESAPAAQTSTALISTSTSASARCDLNERFLPISGQSGRGFSELLRAPPVSPAQAPYLGAWQGAVGGETVRLVIFATNRLQYTQASMQPGDDLNAYRTYQINGDQTLSWQEGTSRYSAIRQDEGILLVRRTSSGGDIQASLTRCGVALNP